MNIFLCGITQNKIEALKDLIEPVWESFDGLIWVDGGSTDGTIDYLESHKKLGKIIRAPYLCRNDFQMNHYLFDGGMIEGDWFVMRDSEEKLNTEFCQTKMRPLIRLLDENRVDCVYSGSKPLMARFNENLQFMGNPHWGLQGITKAVSGEANNKDIAWCNRDKYRKYPDYLVIGEFRYYCYPSTNQLYMIYHKKPDIWRQQEENRRQFLELCRRYSISLKPEHFIDFLKVNYGDAGYADLFSIMEKEDMLFNMIRFFCKNEKADEIRNSTMEKRKAYDYYG